MNLIDPFQPPRNAIFEPSKLEYHISRSESRARAILEIVQNLIDAGQSPVQEIRAAIQRTQDHQAAHMLHTLRGSVANLGGQRVCELAGELEQLLDNDAEPDRLEPLMEHLEWEFALFLADASQWLDRQRKRYILQAHSPRRREERLQLFCDCLAENDLRAFDLFEELQQHLQDQMTPPDFLGFSAALQALDFGAALRYIRRWSR